MGNGAGLGPSLAGEPFAGVDPIAIAGSGLWLRIRQRRWVGAGRGRLCGDGDGREIGRGTGSGEIHGDPRFGRGIFDGADFEGWVGAGLGLKGDGWRPGGVRGGITQGSATGEQCDEEKAQQRPCSRPRGRSAHAGLLNEAESPVVHRRRERLPEGEGEAASMERRRVGATRNEATAIVNLIHNAGNSPVNASLR